MNGAKAGLIFKDICPLWTGLLPPFATPKDKRKPQECSGYLTHWYLDEVFS